MKQSLQAVAKFIRNEPKKSYKQTGLASLFGCCSDTEDKMEVLDDNGNVIATSFLHHDQFRGIEIAMKDPNGQLVIKVRGSREQKDTFFVVGPDNRFLGEIRQKIISSGNSTDNFKGVACWSKAEDIDDILEDYNKLIVPGLSHSSHPNFHSFYPSGNPFHCLLADLLGGHIGDAGFYWTSNPALTELEVIMMDWLGEMMALPKEFLLFPEGSRGGGCMQRSDTESNFLVLVAARTDMIQRMKQRDKRLRSSDILARLVAYTSSDARRSIKKAAEVAMVKMRVLPTDENFILRGDTLHSAIVSDIERGLIPFFVCANFGTSGPCSFDHLHELGPVCRDHGTWLHVDAAYAGTALICPEMRGLMRGIDWADSFCTTPSKLILAVCDVCCLWVRDRHKLQLASLENHPDLPFKGLPTSQRVGALKIWFMIRSFGVENLQNQIRQHIKLGQTMAKLLQKDSRFEVCNKVVMGLICFRIKANDMLNKALLYRCNETGKVSFASCILQNKFVIRMCINSPKCSEEDLDATYKLICTYQNRIEVMNQEDLEEFIRAPAKVHSSAEVSRRFPITNPLEPSRSLHQVTSRIQSSEYLDSPMKDPKSSQTNSPATASSTRTQALDGSEKSDK
uniref:Histidine decarboxylase n=1 Tax=Caenorhabditis tropicalis TaxID=1561998 RepID=A0A1I7U7B2_9PELO